jgi:hypothetical protein
LLSGKKASHSIVFWVKGHSNNTWHYFRTFWTPLPLCDIWCYFYSPPPLCDVTMAFINLY